MNLHVKSAFGVGRKMIFGRVLCLFNRHRPQRDKVAWDGGNYNSQCVDCGKRIYRRQGGGWRATRAPALDEKGAEAQ